MLVFRDPHKVLVTMLRKSEYFMGLYKINKCALKY